MAIATTASIPIPSKDPREAVKYMLGLVRSNAVLLDNSQVTLGLISSSNPGVLVRLADRLPDVALGFRALMGSYRAKTAAEFRLEKPSDFCSYDGDLLAHLSPETSLSLIEELLQSPPGAIRSTHFNIQIKNLRWKNSADGSSGSLDL